MRKPEQSKKQKQKAREEFSQVPSTLNFADSSSLLLVANHKSILHYEIFQLEH